MDFRVRVSDLGLEKMKYKNGVQSSLRKMKNATVSISQITSLLGYKTSVNKLVLNLKPENWVTKLVLTNVSKKQC